MRFSWRISVCLLVILGCNKSQPTEYYLTSDGVAVKDNGSQDPYALAIREENYELAERHARRRVSEFPDDADSWLALTNPLLLTNQFDAAIESCETGMKLDPSNKNLIYTRGFIAQLRADSEYDANPESATKHYRDAIKYYEEALRVAPEFAEPHYGLAAAHEGLANDHAVIRHAKRYLELHPTSPKKDDALDMIKVANEYIEEERQNSVEQ